MSQPKLKPRAVRFVLAVRRNRRDAVPRDWIDRIRRTEGLVVQETVSPERIFVTGPPQVIQAAYTKLAEYLFLEEEVMHDIAWPDSATSG